MFRLGDKVRVKGNPALMAGVVGMTGVVTGITKTTILMDDADGMEWAWKPDCLEIINPPDQHKWVDGSEYCAKCGEDWFVSDGKCEVK